MMAEDARYKILANPRQTQHLQAIFAHCKCNGASVGKNRTSKDIKSKNRRIEAYNIKIQEATRKYKY
jgi:hypothetical protein